jgi:amidophosphoribosyltransferase
MRHDRDSSRESPPVALFAPGRDSGADVGISDELNEACGLFGVYDNDGLDVARLTYLGLYAVQHRGQEGCGIAVNHEGDIHGHKGLGLVPDVFSDRVLDRLTGKMAVGHTRYSTTGANTVENCQPLIVNYKNSRVALAHNGNLVNAVVLRRELEDKGAVFQTSTDSEVIANLISRYRLQFSNIEEVLTETIKTIQGSFAIVMLTPRRLIGIRDPLGIRPLCIGRLDNSYVLASETCALDSVGAKFIRDVEPGEIVLIGEDGIESIRVSNKDRRLCVFEHIYFARPDSFIDGASVYNARLEAGRRLAREHPAEADLVIGVPDSGLTAAIGFSRESGIPYGEGFIKNRYVGRSFIQPQQTQRELSVRIKLNALSNEVRGKRLVMIDDSIVRGTTSRNIVQILKDAGATEVHMRIGSPPVMYPCHFGIDIPSRSQLIAASHSVEEIRRFLGADSLGYLSAEGLAASPKALPGHGFCMGCFTGVYPMAVPEEADKLVMEHAGHYRPGGCAALDEE